MTLPQTLLGALVLLPLLVGALCALLPATARRWAGVLTAAAVVVLTVLLIVFLAEGSVIELALGGHEAPLGITLRADGLSVLFLALGAIVGAMVTLHAVLVPESTGGAGEHPGYWPLWLGCWSGLNAVFLAGDLFNAYVGLELVSLTAVGLVALGGGDALRAALRYMFVAVLGSLLFLVAIGLVVSTTGTLDIDQAALAISQDPNAQTTVTLAIVLLTVGLTLKVALVPMHRWLIPAHAGAPSAVSPLLSALVIKASLVVFLRAWLWLAAPGTAHPAGIQGPAEALSANLPALTPLAWLVAILSVLALVVGSVLAIQQDRLKPLVAYSTVAQAGYWFLFLPILVDTGSTTLEDLGVAALPEDAVLASAVGGTVAMVVSHGIAKAGLFLAAGTLKEAYGTDEIEQLRGAGRRNPMLVMAMGLCAVGLAGLPFSLGFSGKWQLATAALGSAHYWMLPVLVAATLFSAVYLLKPLSVLLLEQDDDGAASAAPATEGPRIPLRAQMPAFVLGVVTIVAGFAGVWSAGLLGVGAPW